MQRRLSGWGRYPVADCDVVDVRSARDVSAAVTSARRVGVIARGLGRSYGDASLNAGGRVVRWAADAVDVDSAAGTVRADAGVSLEQLMRVLTPRRRRLPVLPGTRFVTVGGATAADVHGKNHHADGSFGRWVTELTLVDGGGDERTLSPDTEPAAFWATVAGMGLTGVITSVTVTTQPLSSTYLRVRTRRFVHLDEVMDAMESSQDRYHVAWVDAAPGRGFGRSVLDEGDHDDDGPDADLRYAPRAPVPAPRLPFNVVRPRVIGAFDALWWRRAPSDRVGRVTTSAFFHPLDGVGSWNRLYGPRGFLQWQIAVPLQARPLVERSLRMLATSGAVPALVVLKRFGAASPAPLSFPVPGWTLAVDVAAGPRALLPLLDRLDREVADAGGRVYLAKDARMRRDVFERMYPRLDEWRMVRDDLDPRGVFTSDLARRLGLSRP